MSSAPNRLVDRAREPTMSGQPPLPTGAAEILKLFSGRRRGLRVASALNVDCQGKRTRYRGRIVNVSSVGALVGLRHRAFHAREAGLLTIVGRVHAAFPKGMLLRVGRIRLALRATVVRVAHDPTERYVLLGCEFQRPLTPRECELLEVPPARDEVAL
jgi:hypothetical protein